MTGASVVIGPSVVGVTVVLVVVDFAVLVRRDVVAVCFAVVVVCLTVVVVVEVVAVVVVVADVVVGTVVLVVANRSADGDGPSNCGKVVVIAGKEVDEAALAVLRVELVMAEESCPPTRRTTVAAIPPTRITATATTAKRNNRPLPRRLVSASTEVAGGTSPESSSGSQSNHFGSMLAIICRSLKRSSSVLVVEGQSSSRACTCPDRCQLHAQLLIRRPRMPFGGQHVRSHILQRNVAARSEGPRF